MKELSDAEMDRLVEIMRRHTELALKAIKTTDREQIIKEIEELREERIKILGR